MFSDHLFFRGGVVRQVSGPATDLGEEPVQAESQPAAGDVVVSLVLQILPEL